MNQSSGLTQRPEVDIPASPNTVDVRVIDTGTWVSIKPGLFFDKAPEHFKEFHAPSYCYLISKGDRHVLFDLGVRPDWECCAPTITKVVRVGTTITRGRDVATVLNSCNESPEVRTNDVESVIWSHNHFDHIGDTSTFPSDTELVVGPGVKSISLPGFPSNPNAIVLDTDMEGREVREISFDSGLRIGRFQAYDYFGDGSFYLLDAPGHAVGHMCALARTTATPPSFVFMGADACHHVGVLRPSKYLPLPESVNPADLSPPGSQSTLLSTEPLLKPSRGPMFLDHEATDDTITKIQELDALDEVLVIMAHDHHLLEHIPLYPKRINDWMVQDVLSKTKWLFLRDFRSYQASGAESGIISSIWSLAGRIRKFWRALM